MHLRHIIASPSSSFLRCFLVKAAKRGWVVPHVAHVPVEDLRRAAAVCLFSDCTSLLLILCCSSLDNRQVEVEAPSSISSFSFFIEDGGTYSGALGSNLLNPLDGIHVWEEDSAFFC